MDVRVLLGKFGFAQDEPERLAGEFNDCSKTDSHNPVRSAAGREHQILQSSSHRPGRKPKAGNAPAATSLDAAEQSKETT